MSNQAKLNHEAISNEAMAAAGVQAFFNITERWGLKDEERKVLLGGVSHGTFHRMKSFWRKSGALPRVSLDELDRLSYIMGIYKAAGILLSSKERGEQWVSRPNTHAIFAGKTPLQKMLGGHIMDLAEVRQYLDAERGA